jgi:hypothetical protein
MAEISRQYVLLADGRMAFYERGKWFLKNSNCIERAYGVEEDVEKAELEKPKALAIVPDACAECNGLLTCHGESGECHEESGFSDSQKIKVDVISEEEDDEDSDSWDEDGIEESLIDVSKSCAEVKDAVKEVFGCSYDDAEGEEQSFVRDILKGKVGWNLRGRS